MTEAVTLNNVNVSLDGKWVLRNLTFSVESGEFLGIIGPNGSGKTTLMRVLLRMLKPQEGTVEPGVRGRRRSISCGLIDRPN